MATVPSRRYRSLAGYCTVGYDAVKTVLFSVSVTRLFIWWCVSPLGHHCWSDLSDQMFAYCPVLLYLSRVHTRDACNLQAAYARMQPAYARNAGCIRRAHDVHPGVHAVHAGCITPQMWTRPLQYTCSFSASTPCTTALTPCMQPALRL